MATITIDGRAVGFGDEGTGVPLVLVHGTTQNRTGWDAVRAALPADPARRIITPELAGSGESELPDGELQVDGLVADVRAVVDSVGVGRYHLAGYSLGAVVAAALAADDPDRVASLTLLCGWAASDARQRVTFELWKRLLLADPELFWLYAMADGFGVATLAALEPMLQPAVEMAAAATAPGCVPQADLDQRVDIRDRLDRIVAPTLVIGGEFDRWVDVSHSHDLAARISGARLEVLPYGHVAIQEGAVEVAALLHQHVEANP